MLVISVHTKHLSLYHKYSVISENYLPTT